MSVLPNGRSLQQVLPDLEELLADPQAYLSDSPRAGLLVPINRTAIPFVEWRRNGMIMTTGTDVATPQWRFTGLGEVCLPARYEVDSRDLGTLITWLGGHLGANLPGSPPPAD